MSDTPISRRELVQSGITAGIALAVSPATLGAITTPSDGITAENIEISLSSGERMPGYWAMPKGNGNFPTVLLIHEIFGIHAYIQDVCRRLAKEGYLAICPYLYFRQGDVTKLSSIDEIRGKVISKVSYPQVNTDLDETLAWVAKGKKGDPARTAMTGFCWGGNITWMYSSHNPNLKAGVAWYGRLTGDATALQPKFPLDVAESLKVPVLGLYGGKDSGIPLESVEKMRSALARGKSGSKIEVYADAEHGFHADYRPSYHEKAAKDGWVKMLTWFKSHGVTKTGGRL